MSCGSCGTGGSCSSGCGKLDVHDWLGDMSRPLSAFDAVEVRFKGGRKEFYRNVNNLELYTGDIIVVESQPGHHVGEVTIQGEIVRLQMKKKKVLYNDDLNIIYRKATPKDVEKFEQARNRELTTLYRTRELIREHKLQMKLSDVEYQADNAKATFFYSAEERVDFRELIKNLAGEFKIRVEMKQISLRQEAGRLGGIGSCGRELCCSNWLTDFKNVNTSAARYQNLSLNPTKLSGQCGRLKCCLNYELETYLSAVKEIPEIKGSLKTTQGQAFHQKTDIFKRTMWFSYEKDNNWIALEVERVHEIIEKNRLGVAVHSLLLDEEEVYEDTEINSDLLALDKKLNKKNSPNNKKKTPRENKTKFDKTQKAFTSGKNEAKANRPISKKEQRNSESPAKEKKIFKRQNFVEADVTKDSIQTEKPVQNRKNQPREKQKKENNPTQKKTTPIDSAKPLETPKTEPKESTGVIRKRQNVQKNEPE